MVIALTTELPLDGFTSLQEDQLWMVGKGDWRKAEILISTFDKPVKKILIDQIPGLKLICNFGVGYNNIDLEACRKRGIRVTNTPREVIEVTAELAMALMMALVRNVPLRDRQLRAGEAESFGVMNNLSHSVYGKTLGIIGMGNIGQAFARRAKACGMDILYHNRKHVKAEIENELGASYVTIDELLTKSDVVSLNLPYTPEVHHIIDKDALKKMKSTAYLINTARGAHVDENALVKALKTGEIAGAALDVFEHEPKINEELLKLDNVVLSPHTGTGTWEGRIGMEREVAENIEAWKKGDLNHMSIVL